MKIVKTPYGSIFCCELGCAFWYTSLEEHDRHVEAIHRKTEVIKNA